MNSIKKYIFSYVLTWIEILFSSFFLTLFYYLDWISKDYFSFYLFFNLLLCISFSSFLLGKKSLKKGYCVGFCFGFSFILSFFLITLLLFHLEWKSILYYGLILITSILGSVVGINRKKA